MSIVAEIVKTYKSGIDSQTTFCLCLLNTNNRASTLRVHFKRFDLAIPVFLSLKIATQSLLIDNAV